MPPLRYEPLDDWLRQAARVRPDHPALVTADHTLTYAELDAAADELATDLSGLVRLREPGLDLALRLHACWRAGAVAMPLDQRLLGELPAPSSLPDGAHTAVLTSGTTGEPRLIVLTQANHEASARALGERLNLTPDDRWLCPLPLFHVGGLAILIRAVLHHQTVVLHERFEVDRVREELARGEVTLVSLVPTMLGRLLDADLRRAGSLRAILLGGGPIPRAQLEAGLPIVPTYGMTETASAVATGSPGEPLRGVELAIGGGDEILIRGPMVAPGALTADGWLHTGDAGRLDGAGRLHVERRLKDVIVTGGENVAAARVEAALATHPAVRDAAVVGVPDSEWGEAVTAVVVGDALESELLEHCRTRLAPFEVPKAVRFVDELPRNAAGKLMRDRLVPGP